MLLAFLLFVFALLLPMVLRLSMVEGSVPLELLTSVAGLVVFVAAVWLVRDRRAAAARPAREPKPATIAKLEWPDTLTQPELESWVTAYLRQNGWQVATTQADEAGGVYLDAMRPDARALLLCLPSRALVTGPDIRTLALSTRSFPGARPALLTITRISHNSVQVAADAGVQVLQVPDLARLAELTATAAAAAGERQA